MEEEIGIPKTHQPTAKVKVRDTFGNGVLFAICMMATYQDYVGKKAYLEFLDKYWMEVSNWWIWLIPVSLFLTQYGFDLWNNRKIKRRLVSYTQTQGINFPQYPEDGQLFIYKNHLFRFDEEKVCWRNLGELDASKLED